MNDRSLTFVVFVLGAAVGVVALNEIKLTFFYQIFMREIVMWACGRGAVDPVIKPPELTEFLFNLRDSLSCDALSSVTATQPAGLFVRQHLYLSSLIGMLWRAFGVSYQSLTPLFAVMHGLWGVACYGLGRQFFGKRVAFGLAVVLLLSPVAIGALMVLRDFSKGPFLIGTIALLILAIRQTALRKIVVSTAAAGAVLGLGYGFRTDVLIMVPIGVIMLAVGMPALASWAERSAGIGAFLAGTLLLAVPVILVGHGSGGSGGLGAMVMQGATDPFQRFMGMRAAPYSLGWRYSDELTLSSIAADLRPEVPDWDQNEGVATQSMTQAYTLSTGYLARWVPLFAGDFATKALKSATWIAGFETLAQAERQALDPGGAVLSRAWIGTLLDPLFRMLGVPWMPWVGVAGLLALLLLAYTRAPREAAVLAFLLLSLITYPAIQFSVRHLFYLEVLQWLGLLSLLALIQQWSRVWPVVPRFGLIVGGFAGVVGAVYVSVLFRQDHALKAEVARLLAMPRETVAYSDISGGRFTVPVPERYRALVGYTPDAMNRNLPHVGGTHRVEAGADRLLITIGGRGCAPGIFRLEFAYDKRPEVWQPLDHSIEVSAPVGAVQNTLVIVPAFYRATQNFAAIVVPPGRENCISSLERLPSGLPGLPIIFTAVLPPDWQKMRFFQKFGGFTPAS